MILDEKVLQKLADWQPPAGRQTLAVATASGWSLAVSADRHDELGSLLWELRLHLNQSPEGQNLTAWAQRVAGRVTGLLEPLKVVEIDVQKNQALLRSQDPSRRGERLCYYEVLLTGTQTATLSRYQAVPGNGKREQVAFALTNEAVAKLVADITADE
jgi:hypothetical protein